jgi:hypothetical protein
MQRGFLVARFTLLGALACSGAGSNEHTSPPSVPDGTGAPDDAGPASRACTGTALRTVNVATAAALSAALADARPGDRIVLADGTYGGQFVATASGTSDQPIALCGSRGAVLHGASLDSGYGLELEASFWVLSGFRVTGSQKGIVLQGANNNALTGLEVDHVGQEGIHFRKASSHNVLQGSSVHDTGTGSGSKDKGFGEGVYLGSAESNWDLYGDNGGPDRSDGNQVLDNTLGPSTTAENIDIKEGTTGGLIRGNSFDGTGMSGDNFADSWVDVKGNGYLLDSNHGAHALLDGFQTHVQVTGWGNDNTFAGNAMADVPGFGINVASKSTGTAVSCSNTLTGGAGVANIACK